LDARAPDRQKQHGEKKCFHDRNSFRSIRIPAETIAVALQYQPV
jgi:hypothetical protein